MRTKWWFTTSWILGGEKMAEKELNVLASPSKILAISVKI